MKLKPEKEKCSLILELMIMSHENQELNMNYVLLNYTIFTCNIFLVFRCIRCDVWVWDWCSARSWRQLSSVWRKQLPEAMFMLRGTWLFIITEENCWTRLLMWQKGNWCLVISLKAPIYYIILLNFCFLLYFKLTQCCTAPENIHTPPHVKKRLEFSRDLGFSEPKIRNMKLNWNFQMGMGAVFKRKFLL